MLGAEVSITYFVLSLVSLIGLAGSYLSVSDGLKNIIFTTSIIKIIYGFVLIILAFVVFVAEIGSLEDSVAKSWSAMSQYQKDFFEDDVSNLEAIR